VHIVDTCSRVGIPQVFERFKLPIQGALTKTMEGNSALTSTIKLATPHYNITFVYNAVKWEGNAPSAVILIRLHHLT
jgi:hypothetical protein